MDELVAVVQRLGLPVLKVSLATMSWEEQVSLGVCLLETISL